MKKSIILFLLLAICVSLSAKDVQKRGLFVDRFIIYTPGLSIDSANSILGNPVKEDSLLNYCKTNHVTYLCLYNLYPGIAGHSTLYNTTLSRLFGLLY